MVELIGSVVVTPKAPRPGQSVKVEVLGPDGAPLPRGVTVSIDGLPGSLTFLQFASPGLRRLRVEARSPSQGRLRPWSQTAEAVVEVVGVPVTFRPDPAGASSAELAMLRVRQSFGRPHEVTFSIGGSLPAPRQSPRRAGTSNALDSALVPGEIAPSTTEDIRALAVNAKVGTMAAAIFEAAKSRGATFRHSRVAAGSGGRSGAVVSAVVDLGTKDISDIFKAPAAVAAPASYEWDFGDGQTATTSGPTVTHDYFPTLGPDLAVERFHVRCRIVHAGVEVRRTLHIHSAYVLCKRRGTVVLPVEAGAFAYRSNSTLPFFRERFEAEMTVFNPDRKPVTVTHQAIADTTDDPDAPEVPHAVAALEKPFVIPPMSAAAVAVYAPVPREPGFSGFAVTYAGVTEDGMPVRFSRHFEVPFGERHREKKPFPGEDELKDEKTGNHLNPGEIYMRSIEELVTDPAAPIARLDDIRMDKATGTVAVVLPVGAVRDRRAAVQAARHLARKAHGALRGGLAAATPTEGLRGQGAADAMRLLAASPVLRSPVLAGLGASLPRFKFTSGGAPSPPPPPGPVVEGEYCDPFNIDDAQRAQAETGKLVCGAIDEEVEVVLPGRFMNARKGDIVLSPGGSTLIGSLLRQVDPPRKYSHSGIMTRNYDEVTHSTAVEDRVEDHKAGIAGSEGIVPEVLKYMWPGVVAQSVEAAINGETWGDPEIDGGYSVSSFSPHAIGATHNDRFEVVPPLVVKPDPLLETRPIREMLHAVASDARAAAARPDKKGSYHYRLYCYTDPTIAFGPPAGPEAGWAEGTLPSVCSSFIWMLLKKHGVALEATTQHVLPSDLEPADIASGAGVLPGTPDGLYAYSAQERRVAGQWLYEAMYRKAYDAIIEGASDVAAWLVNLATDAADDLGNQVVNTFASDDAKGKDSNAWRETGAANAVSPDDILFWDSPQAKGLYGYAEPLQYREPRAEMLQLSKWRKKPPTSGTVTGVVRAEGIPVPGATVTMDDGRSVLTPEDGTYSLPDVGFGSHVVWGRAVSDQFVTLEGKRKFAIFSSGASVDFDLKPPASTNRLLELYFSFDGVDDDVWDDKHSRGPESVSLALNPTFPTASKSISPYKWGGEVRVEIVINAALLANGSVQVDVVGTLYEGTDVNTDDFGGKEVMQLIVPKGETQAGILTVHNDAESERDTYGRFSISVKNAQNHV